MYTSPPKGNVMKKTDKAVSSYFLSNFTVLLLSIFLLMFYACDNMPDKEVAMPKEAAKEPTLAADTGCSTGLSALGNVFVRANPLYETFYGDIESYVIANPEHFSPGGDSIRCAQALSQVLMSGAMQSYPDELSRILELKERMGAMGESNPAGLTASEQLYAMGLQLGRLSRVLPQAANGDYGPLNTLRNQFEQQDIFTAQFLSMFLQDPSMAEVLRQEIKQAANLEYKILVNLANSIEATKAKFDEYKVALGANALLKIPGIPGELRVWIGIKDYEPDFPEDMRQTSKTLPAVGGTAKVTPFAPAFEVEPNESICMKIHPSGSEIRFKLIPTKIGIFNVGADVYFFDSDDCSGAPIPKAATTLQVEVKVDTVGVIAKRTKELWEVFWKKIVNFWAAVLAFLFGVVLFLIRGQLKKWLGSKKD